MRVDELLHHYPRLYHMADDGAWPSIRDYGLLSTSALLDLYGVVGEARHAVEARRRPAGVGLARAGLPGAAVRDQLPMTDAGLRRCLDDGMEPADWYRLLNGRVFFWPSAARLAKLLGARAYRGTAQTVLTFDTASLVAAHRDRVELSPINSGATIFGGPRRGRTTFLPLAEYPFATWRAKRAPADAVAEVTVPGGVPDAARHVLVVERAVDGVRSEIWRRPSFADGEGAAVEASGGSPSSSDALSSRA